MKAEIISIGTELLMGEVINTNAFYLARKLAELGINHHHQVVVGDNPDRLYKQVLESKKRSDILIFTGGLGPTYDDLTKEVVAKAFHRELIYHQDIGQKIQEYFDHKKEVMPENNEKQAMIPVGAHIFENEHGTAPGIAIEDEENHKTAILLPGPPHEMEPMFEEKVFSYLSRKSHCKIVSRHLYLYGIGESKVEEILEDMMKNYENPSIAPYAQNGNLMIRITSKAQTKDKAYELIEPVLNDIHQLLGDYVFSIDIPSIEETLVRALNRNNLKIACAESCTGGMIAQRITDIPGSSSVFDMGIVSYANHIKAQVLGVCQDTLEKYGAVSEEVAREMAKGALSLSGADIAIATTGIAGPSGGSIEKPVGLVYIALAHKDGVYVGQYFFGRGRKDERKNIRMHASSTALKLALDFVNKRNIFA